MVALTHPTSLATAETLGLTLNIVIEARTTLDADVSSRGSRSSTAQRPAAQLRKAPPPVPSSSTPSCTQTPPTAPPAHIR